MLFRLSQPYDIPKSTIDSQYDTATTDYLSSSYTKLRPSTPESDFYGGHNGDSPTKPRSRPHQLRRQRNNYLTDSPSDTSNTQYSRPRRQQQQQSIYSTNSPQRPIVNFLLPLKNGETNGNAHQRTRHPNWSSLGSLNSFGDSTTTPSSSQGHTGSGGSNGGGSGGSNTGGSGTSAQKRETLHSRFDFKQTLGKGTYGKVKLALDKRKNEQVAIKTIKKSRIENPHDLARIRREIDFMTSLNHPYIIKIKEVYESREKIILVMEYASGGELYDYLNRKKRIPESQARAIFRQIVSAVHFLHKNHIVHRDLKLENILIDHKGDIKLADFGLSNSWSPRQLLHTFCGSPLYASPEIVSGTPYRGPEVDCWSLGVLLYTLVFGTMPFQGGDYNRLVRNITTGNFIQPREQSGALSLIRYCLTPDANNRATTKDILRHEWLANGPVLSLKLNSITPTSIPLTDQQSYKDYDKIPLRTNLPTTYNEKSVSPTSSLVDLELHTSSFFDTTKIHDNNLLKVTEQQQQPQRRNRMSVASDSTRYYSSTSRPSDRRPLSLSLDDQYPNNPIDYHFASTSEKPSLLLTQPQPYIRRSRRTVSPTPTKTTSSYGNNDRMSSSPITYRYTLATSSDIKKPTSPTSPSIYPDSYDCDTTLRDFKRKPIFKYTPPIISSTNDLNVVPSLSNSTTPVAPSVFTTSAIKFAPAPIRRMSPTNDQENNINNSLLSTARYLNNTISNPSSNIDDSINTATTNHNNRHALLTSYETNNLRKSRLLDDNNNLIPLRVHD